MNTKTQTDTINKKKMKNVKKNQKGSSLEVEDIYDICVQCVTKDLQLRQISIITLIFIYKKKTRVNSLSS